MKQYSGFDNSFGLAGKVAMITGAAQDIGRAIAELFAEKGADLILVDLQSSVTDLAKTLRAGGRKTLPLIVDLTSSDQIDRAVEDAVRAFDHIDILVNNAGVVFLDDAETISEADWDRTMAVNLKAPFMLSQRVAREMIRSGNGGKIVNMASQAAVIALERHVAYCSSKAAVVGMTKVLAVEWAKHNISVNSMSPTVVLTELGKKAWAGAVGDAMKQKIPAGRFGYPEEIAAAALYLCSQAADLITGSNLVIDGGYSIQ